MSKCVVHSLCASLFIISAIFINPSHADGLSPEQHIQSLVVELNKYTSNFNALIKQAETHIKASLKSNSTDRNNRLQQTKLEYSSWTGRVTWESADETDSAGNMIDGRTEAFLHSGKNKYRIFFLSGVNNSLPRDQNVELHGYKLDQSVLVFSVSMGH
ncbi:MAG: hypothetical protein QM500_03240 [Methylococcales bacterium]